MKWLGLRSRHNYSFIIGFLCVVVLLETSSVSAQDPPPVSITSSIEDLETEFKNLEDFEAQIDTALKEVEKAQLQFEAGLDFKGWVLTVNGQSVSINTDGTYSIPNIPAADEFGPGGPGTRPDFLSDDFFRLFGTRTVVNEKTQYAFSEPFQIIQGQTLVIGPLTISDTPPPFPVSIEIEAPTNLIPVGDTVQLTVTGTLVDGSEVDVTARTSLTVYRTSNPAIVTVGENGLVTGNAAGLAFITAVNEGAAAVKRTTVTQAIKQTTVEGFVRLEDSTPVSGASISTPFSDPVLTDAEGFFSISTEVPAERNIFVRATAEINGHLFTGSSGSLQVVFNGITDAGVIQLRQGGPLAILVEYDSSTAKIIDSQELKILSSFNVAANVIDVAVAADGATAVLVSANGVLNIVDLQADPPQVTNTIPSGVSFTSDVDVACTSTDIGLLAGTVRVNNNNQATVISVNMKTGQIVSNLSLPNFSESAASIAVTPDGTLALVGSQQFAGDGMRAISVSPEGTLTDLGVAVLPGIAVHNITISPNGKLALVCSRNDGGTVKVLRIDGQNITLSNSIFIGYLVQSIAFTPDGEKAYAWSPFAGQVRVLQIDPQNNVTDTGSRIQITFGGTNLDITGTDFNVVTADGLRLLVHNHNAMLHVIDTQSDQEIGRIPLPGGFIAGGIDAIP